MFKELQEDDVEETLYAMTKLWDKWKETVACYHVTC